MENWPGVALEFRTDGDVIRVRRCRREELLVVLGKAEEAKPAPPSSPHDGGETGSGSPDPSDSDPDPEPIDGEEEPEVITLDDTPPPSPSPSEEEEEEEKEILLIDLEPEGEDSSRCGSGAGSRSRVVENIEVEVIQGSGLTGSSEKGVEVGESPTPSKSGEKTGIECPPASNDVSPSYPLSTLLLLHIS